MMIASTRLFWSRSVSADVDHVEVVVTVAGTEQKTVLPPETQELVLDIAASTSFAFRVDTFDTEGKVTASTTYAVTLGDLVPPQPATGLGHEILSVREVPDAPPVG